MKIRHGLRDLLFDVSDITNIPSVIFAMNLILELTLVCGGAIRANTVVGYRTKSMARHQCG
jgi:hypothetical protein